MHEPKPPNSNPERSDEIYIEIENFKDYELTNCLAYEMAIRAGAHPIEFISSSEQNAEKIVGIPPTTKDIKIGCYALDQIIYDIYPNAIEHIMGSEGLENVSGGYLKASALLSSLEYVASNLINNNDLEFIEFDLSIYGDEEDLLTKDKLIKIIRHQYLPKKIVPSFSRPIMNNPAMINIDLNLDLPVEDNVALIKHMKEDYDKHRFSDTYKPLEVFKNKFLSLSGKEIKSQLRVQKKIADMFYIYDAKKAGISIIEITQSIYMSRIDVSAPDATQPDRKTINTLYVIAKEYIDDKQYRDLILGKKEHKH